MGKINITRRYLNQPFASILLLLLVFSLIESFSWTVVYKLKLEHVKRIGGVIVYLRNELFTILLPEFVTLFFINRFVYYWHDIFKLKFVAVHPKAILKYHLTFCIPLFIVFWVFDPFTQSARFLLEQEFDNYNFEYFYKEYIIHTYNLRFYFTYLLPSLLMGFAMLGTSLFKDYVQQRDQALLQMEQSLEKEIELSRDKSRILIKSVIDKMNSVNPIQPNEIRIKARNKIGELIFPASEVLYFTIDDKITTAVLTRGKYTLAKSLNDLGGELDKFTFFRIKRDYIINKNAIAGYSYWENGKYILKMKTEDEHEIVVPKARMQEFKKWQEGKTKSDNFDLPETWLPD